MAREPAVRVAASAEWVDEDGGRVPGGEVHGWLPGTNGTVCGLSLYRSHLTRFPHVPWPEVQPSTGGMADAVERVCPRCAAATGGRDRSAGRSWKRTSPRP
ncbi:MAG: hypothetical protein M3P91_01940 [Actinomycetota bacterium]|nr:hypothetical protein [Actinomycetota bacterium]